MIEMDLYKEILSNALANGEVKITFSGRDPDIQQIVEGTCYNALQKIKTIIQNDSLEDRECFMKIEQIVCVLEEIGSSGGGRHDFG